MCVCVRSDLNEIYTELANVTQPRNFKAYNGGSLLSLFLGLSYYNSMTLLKYLRMVIYW